MAGLLQNIQGIAGGLLGGIGGAKQQEQEPAGYEGTLVGYDGEGFIDSVIATTGVPKQHAAITCPAGAFTEVWAYKVPAQQMVALGWGDKAHPNNQGMLYMKFTDNHATGPTIYEGMVRIFIAKGRRLSKIPIWEGRSEHLHPATQDRNNMVMFPYQGDKGIVAEDSLVTVEFMPDKGLTLGWGAEITDAGGDCSAIRLPATFYE
jgi:hypothetical protein